jgi:hypothetical protein
MDGLHGPKFCMYLSCRGHVNYIVEKWMKTYTNYDDVFWLLI